MSYDILPAAATDERLEHYSSLLNETFETDQFSLAYLRWQYRDNPHGEVVGADAFTDRGELAAHYATIPVSYLIDGNIVPGVLSLNTATHPAHQGKGLFTQLASATYATAAERGYEFVVGVANQHSTHGFVKRLDFRLVAPLDVRIGVGGMRRTMQGNGRLASVWSDAALAWRLARPGARYESRGAWVYAADERLGIRPALAHMAVDGPASVAARRTPIPLRMWIGLDAVPPTRGLFAPLPQRLRPSPLNLILRDLGEHRHTRDIDAADIRFGLIDFDAY